MEYYYCCLSRISWETGVYTSMLISYSMQQHNPLFTYQMWIHMNIMHSTLWKYKTTLFTLPYSVETKLNMRRSMADSESGIEWTQLTPTQGPRLS